MATGPRSSFAVVATIAAALGSLVLTSSWLFHVDDRRPSRSAMVGTLEIDLPEGRGLGTAFLVDECGILTNFHVVFGPWYVTALRPPSREYPGLFTLTEITQPDGTHPSARATPVVWGEYHGPDRLMRDAGNDWAYLVLDQCLGLAHGYFRLRGFDVEDLESGTDAFAAIGYSTGRQMTDPACSIRVDRAASRTERWLHDCALLAGDSGGPIVVGTTTAVALGSSVVADLRDPACAAGGASGSGDPLPHLSDRCSNVAVPLSWDVIDRIHAARLAVSIQRGLAHMGYDSGPLGAVEDARATAAIERFQRNHGLAVTGQPSDLLLKIIRMQIYTS